MTEGPFKPTDAGQGGDEVSAQEPFVTMYDKDLTHAFDAAQDVARAAAVAPMADGGAAATDDTPTATETPSDIDTSSAAEPSHGLSSLAELLSHSGVDTVWLDLDGDQVPETQVSIDGPFDSGQTSTDSGVDGWVSVPLDGEEGAAYDISSLVPSGPMGQDWTSPGVQGYDPMALHNFSVADGPVMYDPSGAQSWSPADYTSPDLWFNNGSYDQSAGYWDQSYVAAPGQVDMSSWSAAPAHGNPMEFTQAAGGYDPGSPGFAPFDPSNPLLTYSNPYVNFDPNNPLPTYTPYNGDPSSIPGFQSMAEHNMPVPGMPGPDMQAPGMPMSMPSAAPMPMSMPSDMSSGADYSSYSPMSTSATDVVTNYYTDPTFDDQLSQASADSGYWMDQYHDASDLQSQYWQASVDAYVAGDDLLSYDLNQLSLNAGDAANTAWSNSGSAWDSTYTSSSSTSSADDGWYNAMSTDS